MGNGYWKSPMGQLEYELVKEFGQSKAVSSLITKRAQEVLEVDVSTESPKVGQMKVLAVSVDEGVGKPVSDCKMKAVTLTLYRPEETHSSIPTERKETIRRITCEAYQQGALLTEKDLARILKCGERTIRSYIKELKKEGHVIPLRGLVKNIGRGQTHKHKIIELYLEGKTFTEISRIAHHSLGAIDRYIKTFAKVIKAHNTGFSSVEISNFVEISSNKVEEYLKIYRKYGVREDCKDRIDKLLNPCEINPELENELKKRNLKVNPWLRK